MARRSSITPRKRQKVYERDGWSCQACGLRDNRPRGEGELTIDHIVPLAHGGTNAYRNLQVLCKACNFAKGASPYWKPLPPSVAMPRAA